MAAYLIVADPLSAFIPETDTTTLLAAECFRRSIEVDYLDLTLMDGSLPFEQYLRKLRVSRIEQVHLSDKPAFHLGPLRTVGVERYQVILQRKDPPVNAAYRAHCLAFARASKKILQINHPDALRRYSEHELPMLFPELSIPTWVTNSETEFIDRVRSSTAEVVAKPRNTFSGWGIHFFSRADKIGTLRDYWNLWAKEGNGVVLQDYAPEVTTLGDVRILTLGTKIIGCVQRLPKLGSRLANLHQGASAHPWLPTARQSEICQKVGHALAEKGLLFLGLDLIGDRLSEINITSPSALRQINQVSGICGEQVIIEEIERLRR